MTTYRQLSRNATKVQFSDPAAFFNIVTVESSVKPKKAGRVTVFNAQSAINMQRNVVVKLDGCDDACAPTDSERLALRFSLSGSVQSKVDVQKLIADFRVLLLELEDDLVSGYLPLATSVVIGTEPEA